MEKFLVKDKKRERQRQGSNFQHSVKGAREISLHQEVRSMLSNGTRSEKWRCELVRFILLMLQSVLEFLKFSEKCDGVHGAYYMGGILQSIEYWSKSLWHSIK